ncbi:MAG: 2-oxoacid:acceptor oxidoreductase family protein [Thermoplasmata archaeon]|nr:2-oxoacid:acceptor oxidoreductase family protein [Thermoplasmata archaeon]
MIQIRIGGWAGQGVVLAGTILSQTFSTVLKKNVVMTRSYTAAVRSGVTTSDIIVDDDYIYDLMITEPNVMIIMYQKTFDRYIDLIKKSDHVIIDSTMVKNIPEELKNIYKINASEIAEKISNPRISNMVLLGAYAKITGHIPIEALEKSVRMYVSKRFLDEDIKAIYAGYSL